MRIHIYVYMKTAKCPKREREPLRLVCAKKQKSEREDSKPVAGVFLFGGSALSSLCVFSYSSVALVLLFYFILGAPILGGSLTALLACDNNPCKVCTKRDGCVHVCAGANFSGIHPTCPALYRKVSRKNKTRGENWGAAPHLDPEPARAQRQKGKNRIIEQKATRTHTKNIARVC